MAKRKKDIFSKEDIEKEFLTSLGKGKKGKTVFSKEDIDKEFDTPKIQKFDDFEEDFEEYEFEETPDYQFLKNLYDFLMKKSYPKKCTRRFLRDAYDFVNKDEVSQESLDQFIETEGLDKAIVAEMKKKVRKGPKPKGLTGNIGGGYDDEPSCGGGGGGYARSSC